MIFAMFAVLTLLLSALTFLPVLNIDAWWIRILDFPRLQLSFIILVLLLAQFIFLDFSSIESWIFVGITFFALAYHAWWVLPFTKLHPVEVYSSPESGGRDSVQIITANVYENNRNFNAFLALIRKHKPHIFVTLESNRDWQDQLDTLEHEYPYAVKCAKENLYGMHVYSKIPLEDTAIKYLVEPDVPSIHAKAVFASGQRVQMHILHPRPPFITENEQSTERDAELLLVGKISAEHDGPVIITGDLNDVAWSDTTRLFRKISGLSDPRIGRGMFNTFHAGYWFIRWPLDYFFHSSHFTLKTLKRLPTFGSDHFAILIELNFEPDKKTRQHTIIADSDEKKRADEKIDAAV